MSQPIKKYTKILCKLKKVLTIKMCSVYIVRLKLEHTD